MKHTNIAGVSLSLCHTTCRIMCDLYVATQSMSNMFGIRYRLSTRQILPLNMCATSADACGARHAGCTRNSVEAGSMGGHARRGQQLAGEAAVDGAVAERLQASLPHHPLQAAATCQANNSGTLHMNGQSSHSSSILPWIPVHMTGKPPHPAGLGRGGGGYGLETVVHTFMTRSRPSTPVFACTATRSSK